MRFCERYLRPRRGRILGAWWKWSSSRAAVFRCRSGGRRRRIGSWISLALLWLWVRGGWWTARGGNYAYTLIFRAIRGAHSNLWKWRWRSRSPAQPECPTCRIYLRLHELTGSVLHHCHHLRCLRLCHCRTVSPAVPLQLSGWEILESR